MNKSRIAGIQRRQTNSTSAEVKDGVRRLTLLCFERAGKDAAIIAQSIRVLCLTEYAALCEELTKKVVDHSIGNDGLLNLCDGKDAILDKHEMTEDEKAQYVGIPSGQVYKYTLKQK